MITSAPPAGELFPMRGIGGEWCVVRRLPCGSLDVVDEKPTEDEARREAYGRNEARRVMAIAAMVKDDLSAVEERIRSRMAEVASNPAEYRKGGERPTTAREAFTHPYGHPAFPRLPLVQSFSEERDAFATFGRIIQASHAKNGCGDCFPQDCTFPDCLNKKTVGGRNCSTFTVTGRTPSKVG